MSWRSSPIRRGVAKGIRSGLESGLLDVFAADAARNSISPVPPMPTTVDERIKWAAKLWRDAKARAAEDAPSNFGRLIAAGEKRILGKLLIGLDAERTLLLSKRTQQERENIGKHPSENGGKP